MMTEKRDDSERGGDAVPLFGTWRKAYLAVAVCFFLDVALFYAISRYFS